MRHVLALSLVAVSSLWQGDAKADLIPGSRTIVAGWSMGAYEHKGKFSHCAMSATYNSGITMVFSVSDDYSWRVGWGHEAWRFKTGQGVDLTLFVDNVGPLSLRADATTESLAVAELPAKAALFDLMRKGNRMTVRALGNSYAFKLDGTYAALAEILNCTGRYAGVPAAPLAPQTTTPPGASASAASPPTTPPSPPSATPTRKPLGLNVDRSGKSNAVRLVLGDGVEWKPQAVFEKASGAVYVVKSGKTLGSAIAISEKELLTNCHVVEKASTVTLEREGASFQALVVSANPDADRCVLRTGDIVEAMPKWVRVRPYADVKVGERVFTIGAPRGLELTLAEGIVSSKRVKDDERLFQTSAPISKGSSGGGLFDAKGNLVGITTFMIKDAQNLNFAIAAEEYAK